MKLAELDADESSFSFRDLNGQDVWDTFTPVFGSLTVVGATSYSGRYKFVGRQAFFQVKFSAATSIASATSDYLNLPFTAKGLAGSAKMDNITSNVAVGNCVINVSQNRCYLAAQVASGNVFTLAGWCEV